MLWSSSVHHKETCQDSVESDKILTWSNSQILSLHLHWQLNIYSHRMLFLESWTISGDFEQGKILLENFLHQEYYMWVQSKDRKKSNISDHVKSSTEEISRIIKIST